MTDDTLDRDLARALRSFSDGGIRPIDSLTVAETAIRRSAPRRVFPVWWPVPGLRIAGTLTVALAAVVVVAIVANLQRGDSRTGTSGSPSASPAPTPSHTTPSQAAPDAVSPGTFRLSTPAGLIYFTIPPGWRQSSDGMAVFAGDESYENGTNHPSLGFHDIESVVADACPNDLGDPSFIPVGPTVDDLTTALKGVAELQVVGPSSVTIGGYPGQRLVLSLPDGFENRCGGPEGRIIWRSGSAQPFGLLNGGNASVYVLNVDGVRVVLATHFRGVHRDEQLQLARLVAAIHVESAAVWPTGDLGAADRHSMNVDRVAFSFEVPADGWEQFGRISLNKSIRGPQGAEAMIYWARYPDSSIALPCQRVLDTRAGGSVAKLAAAVAAAPGTEVVEPPSDVVIGGRPGQRLVLAVREDNDCEPGFFYSWDDVVGGAFWPETHVGDTIRVWIADLDGPLLFIGGVSAPNAGAELEQEIESIIRSIQFD